MTQKTARITPGRLRQLVCSAGSSTAGSVQPIQAAAAELSEDVVQQFAGFDKIYRFDDRETAESNGSAFAPSVLIISESDRGFLPGCC
jgi:hypothetical protein